LPTEESSAFDKTIRGCELTMSGIIQVDHKEGDLFEIRVRHHVLHVDQPDGSDAAPNPTELFVVSLASCVAFYARRFLSRHGFATSGLSVVATYAMADRPARVSEIDISINVPVDVPDEQHARLLAVASHCTVHNTLEHPPRVNIGLVHLSPVGLP
jgi:putative redox protein